MPPLIEAQISGRSMSLTFTFGGMRMPPLIKAVKRQGFGYTNANNYRIRVLYRCA